MKNLLTAVLAAAALSAGAGVKIEKNTRLELSAVLPEKERLTLTFGRGQEKLTLTSQKDGYAWRFLSTTGENPQKRPYPWALNGRERATYWWEHCNYTPNGRYTRTFAIPPDVVAACEAIQSERWQPNATRRLAIALELVDGWLSIYLDDILLHALPATEDLAGRELIVRRSKKAVVSEVTAKAAVPAPGWYRVPLGRVATRPGNPAAALTSFQGVPVLPGAASVDVGRSWVREACVGVYGAPNKGTFGGRWAGALSATPTRLQFRVPNRRYEALYLLASCTNNNFVTVQFYRPGSGFPIDCVPAEPIATDGKLQLVRVPLRQDQLETFKDREILEFELTGHVSNYRDHPEPAHYSRHGMGDPSGLAVHAMTLKEAPLEVDFTPEALGNVWVEFGATPAYTVTLRNRAAAETSAVLAFETNSRDGKETTRAARTVTVPAKGETVVRFDAPVKKYGWHAVKLTVNGLPHERSLVVLRKRDYASRPFETKGLMFGSWPIETYEPCALAFKLGIEAFSFKHICKRSSIEPLAKKYGVKDYSVTTLNLGRPWGYRLADLEEQLRKTATPESEVSDPSFQCLFAEPGGIGAQASILAHCGVPAAPRNEAQEAKYLYFKTNLVRVSEIYRRVFPGKKLLMPWGNPLFSIPYLQDPETRHLFDGMGYDSAFFDRLPEGQLHSCSLYTLTILQRAWARYRNDKPLIVSVEGPCISRMAPESLSADEHLRHSLRSAMIQTANGVTRLFGAIPATNDGHTYWAEQHYSGGSLSRVTLNPHPTYAACGTMIRLLRDCEFVRSVPTPSLGLFALEYRNVKTRQPLHVLWTVRGRVPLKVKARQAFDVMDNLVAPTCVTPDPLFLVGVKGDFSFGKQTFDAAETTPAADAVKVATLAGWTQSTEPPPSDYLENMPGNIRRYPVEMKVETVGEKLSVTLPEGLADVDAMPYCTTIVPPKPVVLPGRPRVIALETTTDADWGRIVYVLRDAKGERFVSVGQKRTYNVDDTKCDSFFNFAGTRLIRFELPGNHPWDGSRHPGSCWWGAYGGDDRVDYPLSVEKIYIERRAKAMHVNALVAVKPTPALFGKLYVEGIDSAEGPRMPPPPAGVRFQNPIAELAGTLPATEITGVKHPIHQYDGRRGHFAFREVPEAASYDIYVSLRPTGEGAILLGKGVKKSGTLVAGFLPGRDNYAFIVWRDKKGRLSRPSKPFKFLLEDEFAEK